MGLTFSDYAYKKMVDLYNHHDYQVGSQLKREEPKKYDALESTSCIVYAIQALSHAFDKIGEPTHARKVRRLGKHGTELAKYLVSKASWAGIYINPDAIHPEDADSEHTYSYRLLLRRCSYYGIPISYRVVNYRPTAKTHESFQGLNPRKAATPLNDVDIRELARIKFGFGVSRGGQHTWLFSLGHVYEVHWDKIGADLYEKSKLKNFPWLSGAIVVPPDAKKLLKMTQQKCG